jgi:hypothetical protein
MAKTIQRIQGFKSPESLRNSINQALTGRTFSKVFIANQITTKMLQNREMTHFTGQLHLSS